MGRLGRIGKVGVLILVLAALLFGGAYQFDAGATRAKIAQARLHLLLLAEGLDAYAAAEGTYPYDGYNYAGGDGRYNYWYPPIELTTPVAYLDVATLEDPFRDSAPDIGLWQIRHLRYTNIESTWGTEWDHLQTSSGESTSHAGTLAEWGAYRISSAGPDGIYGPTNPPDNWPGISSYLTCNKPYDPTNGLDSTGDILRSQLSPVGYLNIPQESAATAWSRYR